MSPISLGYSPCPNDTYIFYGLVHGKIDGAPTCREVLEDIETLNRLAMNGKLDMTKISFHALALMRDRYCLLHAGGALGPRVWPARRRPVTHSTRTNLLGKRIAIPGRLTTAALLLRLFNPALDDLVAMPFDEIMDAAQKGHVDAGVIIHESRFTYPDYGLHKVMDLGEWWEASTGHPIPLGGILALRDLGKEKIRHIDQSLRASIKYAHANPDAVKNYIRQHAQEIDEAVMQQHIDLYVNHYTLDYGADGEAAIADLFVRAEEANIVPQCDQPLFV